MKLSMRMEANAALITPGSVLCDVGCDHGYVPIALVERGIVSRAIAMDLRPGPLAKAKENIAAANFADKIETRLSDGVTKLSIGEADSILIAGMGGELVIHILKDGDRVCHSVKELILQPQSELHLVRAYLGENGYEIVDEDMVFEDGKYYPSMKVQPSASIEKSEDFVGNATESIKKRAEDMYGPVLLAKKHAVLQEFLKWEEQGILDILASLEKQTASDKIATRIAELKEELELNQFAQKLM